MQAPLLKWLSDVDTHNLFSDVGYNDFLPSGYDLEDFCAIPGVSYFCKDLMSSIVGPGVDNATLFDQDNMELWLHHFPAGTSSQEMAHYAQLVVNDNLALYDYGTDGNQRHYGSDSPPVYNITNLNKVSLPIALFAGGDDILADPDDVLRLITTVGADRFVQINNVPFFNHMSFVWGKDAPELVWSKAIDLIKKYA